MEDQEENAGFTTCKGIIAPNGRLLIITPSELGASYLYKCKDEAIKAYGYLLPQEWHHRYNKYCSPTEPILVEVPNEEIEKIENSIIQKIEFKKRIKKNYWIYGVDYIIQQKYFKYEIHRVIIGDEFHEIDEIKREDRKDFSIEKYIMEERDFRKKAETPEKPKRIRPRSPRSEKFSDKRFTGRRFQ